MKNDFKKDSDTQPEPTKPKGKPSDAGVSVSKGTDDKSVCAGNKSGPRGFLNRCAEASESEMSENVVRKLTKTAIRCKVDFQAGERACV